MANGVRFTIPGFSLLGGRPLRLIAHQKFAYPFTGRRSPLSRSFTVELGLCGFFSCIMIRGWGGASAVFAAFDTSQWASIFLLGPSSHARMDGFHVGVHGHGILMVDVVYGGLPSSTLYLLLVRRDG
jgi:hypothetical protein